MAKIEKRPQKNVKRPGRKIAAVSPFGFGLDKSNYMILAAGFLVIIIGFFFLGMGEWNSFASLYIAPFILCFGYLVIFPLSIFYKKKKTEVD